MPLDRTTGAKLTFGLLLVGAGALPASSILGSLLGAAGGIGGNWVAEALGGVFGAGPPPDVQLRTAFINAVREAASTLRKEYGSTRVTNDGQDAFALLRKTATSVTTLELPPEAQDLAVVQRELATALTQLLHDFPDAQVILIKQRLLPTTARAFQSELARNDQAWRLYHGWLLERMLRQSEAIQVALATHPSARTDLANVAALEASFERFKEQLEATLVELCALLDRAALAPAVLDQDTPTLRQEMVADGGAIEGSVQQAEDIEGGVEQSMRGKKIQNSSQIATGVRRSGSTVPASPPLPSSSAPTAIHLALHCKPTPTGAMITWEGDRVGSHRSCFFSPYQGSDLDLVVRALEYLQAPTSALSAADLTRLADLGLPTADGMVIPGLERVVGEQLYAALTADANAAQLLATARNAATHANLPLSLSLHLSQDAVALAALPWELLWVAGEPTPLLLSRGVAGHLIRHLDLAQAFPAPRPGGRPLRVLAIVPHAGSTPTVSHLEAHAARKDAWADLVTSGAVTLLPELSPATADAFADTLRRLAGRIDLLHVMCHGKYLDGEGYLVLDSPDDGWAPTPISQIAPVIAQAGARLVLLSACQSATVGDTSSATGLLGGVAPALVAHGVPGVVAMQFTVRQRAAHTMIRVISEALAAGRSVPEAVAAARLQLWSSEQDRTSWYVPTLYVRAMQLERAAGTIL